MEKICPRCKTLFDCKFDNLADCHCVNVDLDARQLEYIADHYGDCLCHSCLQDVKDGFYANSVNPTHGKRIGLRMAVWVLCLFAGPFLRAQSPYISNVYDYQPAPGQFVNVLPEYQPGDTKADMIRKVDDAIANNAQGMISLGGYGGYVIFGFDHLVENIPGRYDFKVLGNAFVANANPNSDAPGDGGSCEPGGVMVAYDANGNGLPDDPWYEIAGSEYRRPTTLHDYRITYHKPSTSHTPVPHPTDKPVNDIEYIRWTTNGYGSGYMYRNIYHNQSYYPLWIDEETYELSGSRLADNAMDESGWGTYWVQYSKHWGYVDNYPNADSRSGMNIEWAVDAGGNPVNLPGIHFIKVYNAINQNCGWLGESSTEILGAEDLHLTGKDYAVPIFVESVVLNRASETLQIGETITLHATVVPANASNKGVSWKSLSPTVAEVDTNGTVTALVAGTAIIRVRTLDGYYTATCTLTVDINSAIKPIEANQPQVWYADGVLYLRHLDGYNCTITTSGGQMLQIFTVASNVVETRLIAFLQPGIYFLNAQKGDKRLVFKFIVR